jgi:uncharacterized protein
MFVPNQLLEGVVGSTVYNLAHAGSDVDKKGIFAFKTKDLHGLNYSNLRDVYEEHAPYPDLTYYEAAKWCNLALKCNPNILELVYLPKEYYTLKTDLGNQLIDTRASFLSQGAVKNSYLKYARSQLHQIEADGKFKKRPKEKTEKHARHLARLVMQGFELYSEGTLTVRLDENTADFVKTLGRITGEGNFAPLRVFYESYESYFENTSSVLPLEPDREAVEVWLRNARNRLF